MRSVHCSWVDMQKIREALSAGERGDQSRLERMRCVDKGTVSRWKAACEVLDAVDGKVALAQLEEFQPTHACELARHYRKNGENWQEDCADELADWVSRCEKEKMTVQQLRSALVQQFTQPSNEACTINELDRLVADGKKFGTIYADPPWQYGNQGTRAATGNHYDTLTIAEIAALPVGELAADKSHLHLWTTDSFFEDAIGLLKGWGFERRQTFVWVKPQLGIGNYWRSSHEYMLLGVRGSLTFPPTDIKSWLEHDRTEHSTKPHAIRKLIERVSPGPRIELFARQPFDGWLVWGNGIEKGMFDQDVKSI